MCGRKIEDTGKKSEKDGRIKLKHHIELVGERKGPSVFKDHHRNGGLNFAPHIVRVHCTLYIVHLSLLQTTVRVRGVRGVRETKNSIQTESTTNQS